MNISCGLRSQKKRPFEPYCLPRPSKRSKHMSNSDDEEDLDEEEEVDIDPNQIRDMIRSKFGDLLGSRDDRSKGKINHLYFDDSVNKNSCRRLINKIDELNIKLGKLECDFDITSPLKIYLHISSYGGSVFDAFNVIDAMQRSKYPIVTIIEGASASAATLISVCGSERWITKHGYMLIHQLSSGCWGKMTEIDDEYQNLTDIMDQIYTIYEEKTQMKRADLRKFLKHDRWWGSEECLKKGLVDKII